MLTEIISAIILIIIVYIFYSKKNNQKEAELKFIFMDYIQNNFYNVIIIKIPKNNMIKKYKINNKEIIIPLSKIFENNEYIEGEIIIKNSIEKIERSFNITIYKGFTNIINININYIDDIFYYSEIIFYGNNIKENIKLNNLKFSDHGLIKRIRVLLYNIKLEELINLIKSNNKNKYLNKKISQILKNKSKKKLFINIYKKDINNSNILIFEQNENQIIINPNKLERDIFSDFYKEIKKGLIDTNIYINNLTCYYINKLFSNNDLFGKNINNLKLDEIEIIYTSFINQGINFLLDNDIITKNDKDFIFGYLILYIFLFENKYFYRTFIEKMINIIEFIEKNNLDEIEQIKAAISFTKFYNENQNELNLLITKNLDKENPYIEGFKLYKNIISDLKEDSDIMLIYLQLNSGFGLELLNNEICYKISMLSIETIKNHVLNNIPKYFFDYNNPDGDFIISDLNTQILSFNTAKIFLFNNKNDINYNINNINNIKDNKNDINDNNKQFKENNLTNVTIGLFHESGQQKLQLINNDESKEKSLLFINNNFEIIKRENSNNNKEGDAGRCVDYFLYKSKDQYCIQKIMSSNLSYRLMKKEYFTGDLQLLHNIVNEIILKVNYSVNKNEKNKEISNNLSHYKLTNPYINKKTNYNEKRNLKRKDI